MTEHAGYLNVPNLIDDIASAICWSLGLSFDKLEDRVLRVPEGFDSPIVDKVEARYVADAALSVLRALGLLNLQGLELIKSEETK